MPSGSGGRRRNGRTLDRWARHPALRGHFVLTVRPERAEVDAFIGSAVILTDDFAPVDQLLGR